MKIWNKVLGVDLFGFCISHKNGIIINYFIKNIDKLDSDLQDVEEVWTFYLCTVYIHSVQYCATCHYNVIPKLKQYYEMSWERKNFTLHFFSSYIYVISLVVTAL